jgi:hypothetical protein
LESPNTVELRKAKVEFVVVVVSLATLLERFPSSAALRSNTPVVSKIVVNAMLSEDVEFSIVAVCRGSNMIVDLESRFQRPAPDCRAPSVSALHPELAFSPVDGFCATANG